MKAFAKLFTLLLVASFIASCGTTATSVPPTAVKPADTAVVKPTDTAVPAPTLPPTPTSTTTPSPAPSPTLTPIPSSTPIPTPTPTPTPAGPQANVLDVINLVDAHALPDEEWQKALVDMIIYRGGEVWAREESTARLGIDEEIIRVAPNTIFTMEQPDADTLQINLQDGQIWLNVEGLDPGKTINIETPQASASVRGTRFSVRTLPGGGTLVSTVTGSVEVTATGQTVTVAGSQQSVVEPGAPPAPPEQISLEEELRWGMAQGGALGVVLPAAALIRTTAQKGQLYSPALSPDGSLLVGHYYKDKGRKTSGALVYNVKTGETIAGMVPAEARNISFSPDGLWIAYRLSTKLGYRLCFVKVSVANPNVPPPPTPEGGGSSSKAVCVGKPDDSVGAAAWSPDGKWVAFYQLQTVKEEWSVMNLYKMRPDGSSLTALTTGPESDKMSPAWSPDGSQIAYAVSPAMVLGEVPPSELWVMDADGANQRKLLENVSSAQPRWKPDGKTLAVAGYDRGLWLVPVTGGAAQPVPGAETLKTLPVGWSPTADGWPLFFSTSEAGKPSSLYYCPGSDQPSTVLAHPDWGPIWSGDQLTTVFGDWIGTVDNPASGETTIHLLHMAPAFYP